MYINTGSRLSPLSFVKIARTKKDIEGFYRRVKKLRGTHEALMCNQFVFIWLHAPRKGCTPLAHVIYQHSSHIRFPNTNSHAGREAVACCGFG